jgi:vacuolar protein-sorting-associated protein 4
MLEGFNIYIYILYRYSGSDLGTLIRDASFEPLRKCERATTFKKVQTETGEKYMPCSPSDPQGVPMKMMQL